MKHLLELQEKRNKLLADCRSMVDQAREELTAGKREKLFSQEEENKYTTMFNEAEQYRSTIDMEMKLSGAESHFRAGVRTEAGIGSESTELAKANAAPKTEYKFQKIDLEGRENHKRASKEYSSAFRQLFLYGDKGLSPEQRATLQADSPVGGGFTLVPLQLADGFIKTVDDLIVVGSKVTKITLTGAIRFGAPELANDAADADWTSELLTGNEDTSMSFGRRELEPYAVAKFIKVSNKLIEHFPGIVKFIMGRLAYKHGITREKAIMTGTGVNQPLGLFTASPLGIPTSRDLATDNTSSLVKFDSLIRQKYNVKQAYHANCNWLFHRDIVNQISREKDTTNQYLWQPSVQLGQPDRLLGFPVLMSEYAPNTITTGAYVGLFGDLSTYWLVDSETLQVQVLNELYARTNQTGYITRAEADGAPVMPEAISRIKLG